MRWRHREGKGGVAERGGEGGCTGKRRRDEVASRGRERGVAERGGEGGCAGEDEACGGREGGGGAERGADSGGVGEAEAAAGRERRDGKDGRRGAKGSGRKEIESSPLVTAGEDKSRRRGRDGKHREVCPAGRNRYACCDRTATKPLVRDWLNFRKRRSPDVWNRSRRGIPPSSQQPGSGGEEATRTRSNGRRFVADVAWPGERQSHQL